MENELEKNTENTTKDSEKNEPEKDQGKKLSVEELEAKLKALEAENGKLRQANTNASADASAWKKKYNDTLSEADRKKAEQDEQSATLQKELETLRAERNVANYKSQLISPEIGFDGDLAQEVAQALNEGDIAKVFDGLRKFVVAHDKSLKENAFRNNPTLPGGTTVKAVTKEQFDAMGYKDRLNVYKEHPDLYKEFTK